jgi:hypothetical protein
MTISKTMILAGLSAVVLTGSVGANSASAHGTCSATPSISKNSSTGNIIGRATFSCSHWHRNLSASVVIERRTEAGSWAPVSETGNGTGSGTSVSARIATPCSISGDYRAVATGRTGNEDTPLPHISQNPGGGSNIACFSSDLTNPASAVEIALFRIPTVGV